MLKKDITGTALITALFIMAIVAISATAMTIVVKTNIRRTSLAITDERFYAISQGGTYLAIDKLLNNKKQNKLERRFQSIKHSKKNHRLINIEVEDMQSRFNINNLANINRQKKNKQIELFAQLIKKVVPDQSAHAESIAIATADWVNPPGIILKDNNKPFNEQLPYKISHRLMASISELRLIPGISSKIFLKLEPWISALPSYDTQINIVNAPEELVRLINSNIDEDKLTQFIKKRIHSNLKELQDIKKKLNISGTLLSDYFMIRSSINKEDSKFNIYTLVMRNKNNSLKIIFEGHGNI